MKMDSGLGTRKGGAAFLLALVMAAGCECGGPQIRKAEGVLEVDVAEGRIDFGRVRLGESRTVEVLLANTGSASLSSLKTDREGLPQAFRIAAVPNELSAGRSVKALVTFAPSAEGPATGTIVFRTESKRTPEVALTLAGEGVRTQIVVTPPILDFGAVAVGEREARTLTVTNEGGLTEGVVLKPLPTGSSFEVSSLGGAGNVVFIDPGGSAEIPVSFAPRIANPAGEVALLELAPCEACATQTVELRGVGADSLLVAEPSGCLEFGEVSPGTSVTKSILLRNLGARAEQVLDAHLADAAAPFAHSGSYPVALEGGGAVELPVTFAPTTLANAKTDLVVSTSARSALSLRLCVRGTGGGPDISVQPAALDFGQVAVGVPRRRRVLVTNRGLGGPAGGLLEVRAARIVGAGAPFSVVFPAPLQIPIGGATSIEVEFAPVAEGAETATLELDTNDLDLPTVSVPLSGRGRVVSPCQIEARPEGTLAFGRLAVGLTATLEWSLRNTGTDDCLVDGIRLRAGSAPAFSLPTPPSELVLAPGERFRSTVSFAPTEEASSAGDLDYRVSNPTRPDRSIALSGESGRGCLVIAPNEVDFGAVAPTCAARVRELRMHNACAAPLRVQSIRFDEAGADSFVLAGLPASLPATIQSGSSISFRVGYRPMVAARHHGVLQVTTDERPAPYAVPVSGNAEPNARQTDTYQQTGRPSVDVVFVIDDSGSMQDEQESLALNFQSFINYAVRQGIDYQIGITTTDTSGSGAAGRFLPLQGTSGQILTPRTPDVVNRFANLARVGINGSGTETGLRAMELAITQPNVSGWNQGFLRENALLSVIIVSDEEDYSTPPAPYFADFLRNIKGATRSYMVNFSVICRNDPTLVPAQCDRYRAVASATGGTVTSIETTNWATDLERIGTTAFGFRTNFALNSIPVDPAAIEVRVNGTLVPRQNGGATVWSFDPAGNAINFDPLSAPEPGARLDVSYRVACGQ